MGAPLSNEESMATSAAAIEEVKPPDPAGLPGPRGAPAWRSSAIFWAVVAGLLLRLAFLFIVRTYVPGRIDDTRIAGETTNIATSIAIGHGFSSALNGNPTGPTAWLAPVYPYFVSFVFRWLGSLTTKAVIFLFVAQSLFSALTVVPIFGIATRTVGRQAGHWAAWIWALFPWFSRWGLTWVWDTSLSALLLAALFWYTVKLPEEPVRATRRMWIGFGASWGFALLVNPSLGAFLPLSLAWRGYQLYRRGEKWFLPAVVSIAACAIVISPWLVRNRAAFGQWVFLRSNFGFEFALGNYHGSLGRGWGTHPSGNKAEFGKYLQMGEIAYVHSRQEQALQFVKERPREFFELTVKRLSYFWDGSSMEFFGAMPWYWAPWSYVATSFLMLPALLIAHRRRLRAWPLFFGLLLLYPIPYYLTFTQVRYRHPIEPIMVLLIAYAGVESACGLRTVLKR
jgi:4-amino-4-deoxy-L-arabinose transferase-like glycosyltransferase